MNHHVDPPINIDLRVEQYVKLRDKIDEIRDRHKEELAPYNQALESLGNLLLAYLDSIGADNVRAKSGTPYKRIERSASIADPDAFRKWVIANKAWDFLDWKANKTAVHDHIKALAEKAKHDKSIVPVPPPGVNYSETYKIGVNRAKNTHE